MKVSESPKFIWIWGPAGIGKSHMAFRDYNPDTHYKFQQNIGWDYYENQEIVIFDNVYEDTIKLSFLINLLSGTDCRLPRSRKVTSHPLIFNSKKIIVTSLYHPQEIYQDIPSVLLEKTEIVHITSRKDI